MVREQQRAFRRERRDQRSAGAQEYRRLYNTSRWRAVRLQQLTTEPLCQRCKREGRITQATICHHMDKASKENPATFYNGPFESRCAPCHDRVDQAIERGSTPRPAIGKDGWPIDGRGD